MALDNAAIKDVLAQIYSEIHASASGNINQKDFIGAKLTQEQVKIIEPIELVRAVHDFTKDLHKDAQDVAAAQASINNSPGSVGSTGSVRRNSRDRLLLRRMARYQEIAEDGLMILCILSFSPTFRKSCVKDTDANWQALRHEIQENFESIEYFAKVRGLQWANLLEVDHDFRAHIWTDRKGWLMERLGDVRVQYPHAMIVPEGRGRLRLPMYEGRAQVNISKNTYRHDLFSDMRFEEPPEWPEELDYPSDPSARLEGTTCINCRSTTTCGCDPRNCDIVQEPLMELYHYNKYGARGTGIRTLQKIKKNTVLGEYLGEIVPSPAAYPLGPNDEKAFRDFDTVYAWDLPVVSPVNTSKLSLGTVASGTYGNWTRYVNHSCEPSLKTSFEVIGNKVRILYRALQAIEPFEELTTHYGDYYFTEARVCQCGTDNCEGDFVEVRARLRARERARLRKEARERKAKT
ncbi:hypothetical protein MMC30_007998 [Trapelia coarctata]|nr:hypothetical protein [Trapelia coarctata]